LIELYLRLRRCRRAFLDRLAYPGRKLLHGRSYPCADGRIIHSLCRELIMTRALQLPDVLLRLLIIRLDDSYEIHAEGESRERMTEGPQIVCQVHPVPQKSNPLRKAVPLKNLQ